VHYTLRDPICLQNVRKNRILTLNNFFIIVLRAFCKHIGSHSVQCALLVTFTLNVGLRRIYEGIET